MVLDAYKTVFMWIGRNANNAEKKNASKKVQQYIDGLNDGRDKEAV